MTDEKRNSVAMLPLLVAFFASGALSTFAASALPELRVRFDISASGSSFLFVVWGVGIIAGSLGSAKAIQSQSGSGIFVCAALAGAYGAHLGAGAETYRAFLLSHTLLGAASGAIITTGHGVIGQRDNPRTSSNISALDFALSIGAVAAPMLITHFHGQSGDTGGSRLVLEYLRAALLCCAAFVAFIDFGESPPVISDVGQNRHEAAATIRLSPVLLCFAAVSFFHHAFEYGHVYWFVTYASGIADLKVKEAREILVAFLSGVIVARLLLSWLASETNMRVILSVSTAIAVAIAAFMNTYETYTSLYLANVAFGLSVGAIYPALLATAVTTSDSHGAVFSSVGLISGSLGAQLGALLLGLVVDAGEPGQIYPIIALVGLPLLISINLLIRRGLGARAGFGHPITEKS